MNIGNMIKQRRQELGLTLEDVGKAVGVGKSTVRKWECGQIKAMKRDKISALAAVLHLSPVSFIFVDEATPQKSDQQNDTTGTAAPTLTDTQKKLLALLPDLNEDDLDDLLLLASTKANRHKSQDGSK